MTAATLTPPVGIEDHAAGPPDAPLTLVEYGDFECPHCGRAYPIVRSIQRTLGPDLRLVFRNFPLRESHPHAGHAAEAAEAAGAQERFWEMHGALFEHQTRLEDHDLIRYAGAIGIDADRVRDELERGTWDPRVRADFRGGLRSGVNGTPTFFVNGARFDGQWSDEPTFLRALRSAIGATRS